MDKILQSVGSRDGGISVTNDGATILRSIQVDNAAAKVLVNIAKTQASIFVVPIACTRSLSFFPLLISIHFSIFYLRKSFEVPALGAERDEPRRVSTVEDIPS